MRIHTFTIVCGTKACNASCPYCVSKMTPGSDLPVEPDWRNFAKGARLAADSGVTTALVTGKGEPALYPELLKGYVAACEEHFPLIELQTNGGPLAGRPELLGELYEAGLTTICISVTHHDPAVSCRIMRHNRPMDHWQLVSEAHDRGIAVRMNCTLVREARREVEDVVDFAGEFVAACSRNSVEQITLRNVSWPGTLEDQAMRDYIDANRDPASEDKIKRWLDQEGTLLLRLPHGGFIYDLKGQNVCLYTCLTESEDPNDIRQLIYFPDGHLRYSWQYPGAILL